VQWTDKTVNWHKVWPTKNRFIYVNKFAPKLLFSLAFSLVGLLLSLDQAVAQFDPSSSVLLKPTSSLAPSLDSSRYKVRTPEGRKDDEIYETPGTLIPSPVPSAGSRSRESRATKSETSTGPAKPQAEPATPLGPPAPAPTTTNTSTTPPPTAEPPPVTVQVKHLILGGTDEDIEEYRTKVQPDDPRGNILSVSLAPAYYYLDSSSSYTFHKYSSQGPGFGLGMNVWLTPFLGIQSRYFSSLSGSVRDGAINSVGMDLQDFEGGIRFRKSFGYSLKSPQLIWGVDYHDNSAKISKQATTIVGRKTSGLGLAMEANLPSTARYAHTIDLAIRPFQQQSELQTGVVVKSGTKSETQSLSLGVGGVWTLDRSNQIFWRGQYSVERNLFNGTATQADAHGNTPEGVSVTNTLVMFYFGFKWGS
jgi:hypothetical protein